ncbi:MAG: LrgB family protein [Anaerolineae bacterium]|jgi:predicted murein hydrolase (TIGR00659 family)|nr:LrgB family protein [Anaerolineae bacterium]
MRPNPTAWSALLYGPLLWLTVTLLVYQAAQALHTRTRSAWLNPVLVSIVVMTAILLVTQTPYDGYAEATSLIHFLLGPATVALAVPLYHRLNRLKSLLGPIAGALVVGALAASLSAIGLGKLLGASDTALLSLAPKSVTTPIAMGIAEKIGGQPSLTAVLVILTGIIGAVGGIPVLDLLHIKDASARGFAMGLAAHGIGTARAFQIDEETGAFSGLGMGLNGIVTAIIIPVLVELLHLVG